MYTVLHIFRQVLFGAENQGNHQNFEKSLLSHKCWLIFIGMKQNFFDDYPGFQPQTAPA